MVPIGAHLSWHQRYLSDPNHYTQNELPFSGRLPHFYKFLSSVGPRLLPRIYVNNRNLSISHRCFFIFKFVIYKLRSHSSSISHNSSLYWLSFGFKIYLPVYIIIKCAWHIFMSHLKSSVRKTSTIFDLKKIPYLLYKLNGIVLMQNLICDQMVPSLTSLKKCSRSYLE